MTTEINGQANNTEAAIYNISVGSVLSGIGAVLNKEPGEETGKVLLKGMAQGAIGGYLVYESKILIGKIAKQEKLDYGWPAKIVNSAGISIIENAASNRNFWDQWNLNIGFNRIEFHTKGSFAIKYKILPAAFVLNTYSAIGNKFELESSLKTGEFIFSGNSYYNSDVTSFTGVTIGTSIIIEPGQLKNYDLISHELIHVYQYQDFNVFNTYVNSPLKALESNSKFFNEANNWLHYDFNFFIKRPLYMAEHFRVDTSTRAGYNKNFFEQEASYYSNL